MANFISQILQQNGLITSENGCIIYFQGFSHKEVNFGMNDRILMENDWLKSFVSRESILNDSTNDLTLGYQKSDSASSSKFHHLALFALLVALVSCSSNFHHLPLLALLVALVLH